MTTDGQIVAATFDADGWYAATIDPATLAVTRQANFGDLSGMSELTYDSLTAVAYTVGQDHSGNGASFLYSASLALGTSTKLPVAHPYVLPQQ